MCRAAALAGPDFWHFDCICSAARSRVILSTVVNGRARHSVAFVVLRTSACVNPRGFVGAHSISRMATAEHGPAGFPCCARVDGHAPLVCILWGVDLVVCYAGAGANIRRDRRIAGAVHVLFASVRVLCTGARVDRLAGGSRPCLTGSPWRCRSPLVVCDALAGMGSRDGRVKFAFHSRFFDAVMGACSAGVVHLARGVCRRGQLVAGRYTAATVSARSRLGACGKR